jgi:transcription initiation factor TFIID TATA-box-binding protein
MKATFHSLMRYRIVNVVSTADLQQQVDLKEIAALPHTIHDPEIYGGRVTYLKTPEMYGKSTIFPSGKLINVGSKSPEQAAHDLRFTSKYLERHNLIEPVSINSNTRNLVAVTTFTGNISLEDVSDLIGAMYEPEQFPGAILKLDKTNATYLIFQSGKIVIVGTKKVEELEKSVQLIHEILYEYE